MRIIGTILAVIGTLMTITGVRLAFTNYDFSSSKDVSTWVGSTGVCLLIVALGFYLIKRGSKKPTAQAGTEPGAEQKPARAGSGMLIPLIIVLGCGFAFGLLQIADAALKHVGKRSDTNIVDSQGEGKTFKGGGISFSLPEGWRSLPPRQDKTLALLVSPNSTPREPKAMIMVESGRPSIPDMQGTAKALAKQWGATVANKKTVLDGAPSLRVHGKAPGPGVRPVEAIVTIRDGRLYLIMGGVAPGETCADAVEHVRKTWKWAD